MCSNLKEGRRYRPFYKQCSIKGSHITGAMGSSNGIVPMLRVFNSCARYVDQMRRKGAIAIYLEPWHSDVYDFLELEKTMEMRRGEQGIFLALWMPDLFMQRVKNDEKWTLFSPSDINLQDVHSEEFNRKYIYAEKNIPGKSVRARDLWKNYKITDRDRSPVYHVQGQNKFMFKSKKSGHHPRIQPVRRDSTVHVKKRGCSVYTCFYCVA